MRIWSIKSFLVAFALLSISESVANASPSHGGSGTRIEMLRAKLNLSDEQANRIAEIIAKGQGSCRAYETQEERRSCWKQTAHAKREQIQAILSPEQQAQFAEMRAKRQAKRLARKERCGR